jgi:hypothetical protein
VVDLFHCSRLMAIEVSVCGRAAVNGHEHNRVTEEHKQHGKGLDDGNIQLCYKPAARRDSRVLKHRVLPLPLPLRVTRARRHVDFF